MLAALAVGRRNRPRVDRRRELLLTVGAFVHRVIGGTRAIGGACILRAATEAEGLRDVLQAHARCEGGAQLGHHCVRCHRPTHREHTHHFSQCEHAQHQRAGHVARASRVAKDDPAVQRDLALRLIVDRCVCW